MLTHDKMFRIHEAFHKTVEDLIIAEYERDIKEISFDAISGAWIRFVMRSIKETLRDPFLILTFEQQKAQFQDFPEIGFERFLDEIRGTETDMREILAIQRRAEFYIVQN